MKNKRKKLGILAYTLAGVMAFAGCKATFEEISRKYSSSVQNTTSSSQTTDIDEDKYDEVIEDILSTVPSTEEATETTIYTTEETISQETTMPPAEITTPPTETAEIPEETITKVEETQPIVEEDGMNLVVTATTEVNIRTGSSTNALKIGTLNIGESAIRLMSCGNGWSLVKTADKIGYINENYLEPTGEQVAEEYNHILKNDIVLTTSELNFRKTPSINAERIARFAKDTELQVVAETDNGWLLVKYNGELGYVSKDYTISLLDRVNEQYPELSLDQLDTQKVVYSTTTLNIRTGNSTDYDILSQLEKYESVRVMGEYDDWYLIMTNNYNFGYVSKEYTKDLEGVYVVVDKSEQQLYMYNNDELYFTTPVTTGKDSTPSDTGLFKIYSKETNRYLTDGKTYNSWVAYWMPYNGGEGLHDASWRSVFGTESYHTGGSHGCINIPSSIADDIYNNASVGDKVLVHK